MFIVTYDMSLKQNLVNSFEAEKFIWSDGNNSCSVWFEALFSRGSKSNGILTI